MDKICQCKNKYILKRLKNKLAMRVSFNPISAFYDLKQTLGKGSSAKVIKQHNIRQYMLLRKQLVKSMLLKY